MIKPFSKNVIFFDTEFTDLDPNRGELISIGLVKHNGEELYVELEYEGDPTEWVKENVLPFLSGKKIGKKEAVGKIQEFVGNTKPYIVGYINSDDVIYWQKLYRSVGVEDNIFNITSIDFATILFMLGVDPEKYYFGNENGFFQKIGIDCKKYNNHNALDDAKLLRETYYKFLEDPSRFIF